MKRQKEEAEQLEEHPGNLHVPLGSVRALVSLRLPLAFVLVGVL